MASGEGHDQFDNSLNAVQIHTAILEDRLRDACQLGDLDLVKDMLHDLSAPDVHVLLHSVSGCTGTPLFDAVIAHQLPVVKHLVETYTVDLEQECAVNIFFPFIFRDTCSLLCLACACGEVEIARLLLEHGAEVNRSSLYSSPLIYASECNNVSLVALLLQHGADMTQVPQCLEKDASTLLPLYHACVNGHRDTAELLLRHPSANHASCRDKHLCLRALLGAQCINKHQDYTAGLQLWQQTLAELSQACGAGKVHDLSNILQKLHIPIPFKNPVTLEGTSSPPTFVSGSDTESLVATTESLTLTSIYDGLELCGSVEELDEIADSNYKLATQSLLVLESVLGAAHPETTKQLAAAATRALEAEQYSRACKLMLYIVDSHERQDSTEKASEFMAQLADVLLDMRCSHTGADAMHRLIPDLTEILLRAVELAAQGVHKVFSVHAAGVDGGGGSGINESVKTPRGGASAGGGSIRQTTEMLESLVALIRLLLDDVSPETYGQLCETTRSLLRLAHRIHNPKYNFELDMLKLAVYGGHSALSTLYYYQEELFPSPAFLQLLLRCGTRINCRDQRGDTPLHFSLECTDHRVDIVHTLLEAGAHVDIHNQRGVTPYQLLTKATHLGIQPFDYMSLKCLAAQTIMRLNVDYKGQIPSTLELFVPLHGVVRVRRAGNSKQDLIAAKPCRPV